MRRLACFAFSFAAACVASTYWFSSALSAAFFLVVIIIIAVVIISKKNDGLKYIIACAGIAAGLLYVEIFDLIFIMPLRTYDEESISISAEVCDFPRERDYGVSVDVKVKLEGIPSTKMRVYIYDGSADELKPGDKIFFDATVSVSDIIGEDTSDYFFSQGIYLTARSVSSLRVTESTSSVLKYFYRYIGKAVRNIIDEIFPDEARGLAQALIIGDKTLLSENVETTVNLQRSGIYHIATVSGMHVSILTALLYALMGKKRRSLFVIIPSLFVFMGVTGFTPSVVRAVIMQLFILLAPFFRREDDRLTSLSSALLVLVLINPYVVKSVGMQLSFLSTLGIILFSPGIQGFINRILKYESSNSRSKKKAVATISSSLSASVGAMVLTLPLSGIYFGYISLAAPLTNLLTGWLISPAFVLSLLAVIVGFLYVPFGEVLALLASAVFKLITIFAGFMAGSFFSALYLENIYLILWLVFVYAIILVFILLKKDPSSLILPSCVAVSSLCIILIFLSLTSDSGTGYYVEVLDVGQGQSIVIYNSEYTVVIDCGSSSGEDAGLIATSFIYGLGRDSVDALILTHYHSDHANGVEELMAALNVELLILPDEDDEDSVYDDIIISLAEKYDSDIIFVYEDIEVHMGSTVFTLYAPLGSESENERGVCVLISENTFDTLVTGDISSELEQLLISLKSIPDIECLIVGHHGSKYSTCEELLSATKPEVGIISVGENSYGHPTEETLGRLEAANVDVYRTDVDGSICVSSSAGGSYGNWVQ